VLRQVGAKLLFLFFSFFIITYISIADSNYHQKGSCAHAPTMYYNLLQWHDNTTKGVSHSVFTFEHCGDNLTMAANQKMPGVSVATPIEKRLSE